MGRTTDIGGISKNSMGKRLKLLWGRKRPSGGNWIHQEIHEHILRSDAIITW